MFQSLYPKPLYLNPATQSSSNGPASTHLPSSTGSASTHPLPPTTTTSSATSFSPPAPPGNPARAPFPSP
ncbi:hypothetical protein Pyn_30528 [Prunus yedoensis var. nudiflora]|uniref:Uncharacterized protein n=1 Tax=Prunus yedoensis var. nudiflora TaxID=2094558 RepID=A0A314XER9_PRUYE|nr:hypothetical protein Pyn_30528 [Prunus yedoensis var. nudiflora]